MEKNNKMGEIREIDYAAWTELHKGKNTFYVSIHATDVGAEGLEPKDLVLVKLVKMKKYNPLLEKGVK